jgi:hypothetical protein
MALANAIRNVEYYNTDRAFTDDAGDQVTSTSYVTLQRASADVKLDMTGSVGARVCLNVIIQAIASAGTEEYWLKIDDAPTNAFAAADTQSTEYKIDKDTDPGKVAPLAEIVIKNGWLRVQSKVANSGDWTPTVYLGPSA